MALILKKDIGLGELSDAYVSFEIEWSSIQGGRWKIDTTVWANKRVRELSIVREWLLFRAADVKQEIPYNEVFANKHGIERDLWDEATSPGPWDTVEDLENISKYTTKFFDPINSYSYYFYDNQNVKNLPTKITQKTIKKDFYKAVKDTSSPLFNCIATPGEDNKEIYKSIKDDMETKKDVILRLAKKEPVLTKLAPSESVLMWPLDWE